MTFHRPVFGRKQPSFGQRTAAPQPSAPAPETRREADLPPAAPESARMTQERADAIQQEQIEIQRQFLEGVNAQMLSGTSVVAYAMLPWSLWNGPYGEMLAVTCGLWPQQPWNTMLLAADQRSSAVLGLPEHPGGYPDGLIPQLDRLLGELREGMDAEMAKAKASPSLTWDAVEAWEAARVAMIPNIIAMSHYVGQMCVGEDAFARHKQLFAKTLGWPVKD